jgi:superoxide reductase
MAKFYRCEKCGNIVALVENGGGTLVCCGEPMKELVANTTDAATEKHVPVVEVSGSTVTVTVGSVIHPMTEEHHIAWIALETNQGIQCKALNHTGEPKAVFSLAAGEKAVAAYEYCNLHGLWKKEV